MIEPSRISCIADRIKPYFEMVEADSPAEVGTKLADKLRETKLI